MPKYPGTVGSNTLSPTSPALIEAGMSVFLFGTPSSTATTLPPTDANVQLEAVATGNASIAFTMPRTNPFANAPAVSIEIRFSAAPGAFEIDIQEADTDADNFYILPTGSSAYKVTAVNATTFIARVDLIPTGGRFMRLLFVSLTNVVTCVAKATALS